jgi:hypothetical protein
VQSYHELALTEAKQHEPLKLDFTNIAAQASRTPMGNYCRLEDMVVPNADQVFLTVAEPKPTRSRNNQSKLEKARTGNSTALKGKYESSI